MSKTFWTRLSNYILRNKIKTLKKVMEKIIKFSLFRSLIKTIFDLGGKKQQHGCQMSHLHVQRNISRNFYQQFTIISVNFGLGAKLFGLGQNFRQGWRKCILRVQVGIFRLFQKKNILVPNIVSFNEKFSVFSAKTSCRFAKTTFQVYRAIILSYIADLPLSSLCSSSSKSENIPFLFASLRSLIILLSSIEFRHFWLAFSKLVGCSNLSRLIKYYPHITYNEAWDGIILPERVRLRYYSKSVISKSRPLQWCIICRFIWNFYNLYMFKVWDLRWYSFTWILQIMVIFKICDLQVKNLPQMYHM